MKAVKAYLAKNNPDRVEAFEKGAAAFAKKIVGNFKDFEFVSFLLGWLVAYSLLDASKVHRRDYEPRWLGLASQLS